eukprot:534894-Pelagomonas_calceolata.AAC.3
MQSDWSWQHITSIGCDMSHTKNEVVTVLSKNNLCLPFLLLAMRGNLLLPIDHYIDLERQATRTGTQNAQAFRG